jgi:SAM-dependent methyltransferase
VPGLGSPYAPLVRLNAICPYYTMFPLSFPYEHLAAAEPGEWVLDPFCGRGTTLYAARLRGLPAMGIDSNPVAVAIAAAKLVTVHAEEVIEEAERILQSIDIVPDIPSGPFWELAYHPDTLRELCTIRTALLRDGGPESWLRQTGARQAARVALRALMLGILHGPRNGRVPSYLSNQMPRTYASKPRPAIRFWQARRLSPAYVDTLDLIRRRAAYIFASLPLAVPGTVICADSRLPATYHRLPHVPVRWIITSPPYFGMRTYRPDQWLRNWFLGGPPAVDYSETGQFSTAAVTRYVTELAQVWRLLARLCAPGARLIVRFGALPSLACDPLEIIRDSLERADGAWRFVSVSSAGLPPRARRQASQFGKPGEGPAEIDVVALRA